jgi:SAM-dependent methyltransferase
MSQPPSLPTDPSPWVVRHAGLASTRGRVLDVACGAGRNGRFFLQRGHPTVFVDIDAANVRDLAGTNGVEILEIDLETKTPNAWPYEPASFAVVVATNYLWRPLIPTLIDSVAPGGVFLYETFAIGNEVFGRPKNPDFLLKAGELLEMMRGKLRVVAFGQETHPDPNPAVIQHIAAMRD